MSDDGGDFEWEIRKRYGQQEIGRLPPPVSGPNNPEPPPPPSSSDA